MTTDTGRTSRFSWPVPLWTAGIAIGLGVIAAGEHYLEMSRGRNADQYGWGHALSYSVPFWALWALAAPLVAAIARSVPRRSLVLQVGLLLLAGAALAALLTSIEYSVQRLLIDESLFGQPVLATLRKQLPWWLPNGLLVYAGLVGVTYATDLQRRYREREMAASRLGGQLARAELHALRMQLNPHFLFNTMNSIAMLVRHDEKEEAVRTIAGLSDLLRTLLEEERPHEVSLREELDFLRRYLEIERIRFQDRLEVDITADNGVLDAQVPTLVLQPLVENAIRHGIARRTAAGRLAVSATRMGDRLVLKVTDDGPGLNGWHPGAGMGVGLRNTQARLQQLYGSQQRLELQDGSSEGSVATIELPFHLQPLEIVA